MWLETGSSVQRMQERDRDCAHDNDLKSMYMLFILKQNNYWVVSRTSTNRNLKPSKDTETKHRPTGKISPQNQACEDTTADALLGPGCHPPAL